MLDSLKNRWLLLSPRGKTLSLWGVGFSIIVILVLGLSSKPIKAPVRVISKSEIGVFNVDDEDITIEALGTKLKAQEAQMDLFKQQLTATNGQLLKAKEIISSMSGSDRNIRTLNELSRKVQSFDDKLNGVVEKNQYYSKNNNDQQVVIEQPVVDSKVGDSKTKLITKRVVSSKIVKHDTDTDFMDYSAKKIPDDPLAFVRSISEHQDSHKKEKNVYLTENNSNLADVGSSRSVGKIEILSNAETSSKVTGSEFESEYVGERILAGSLLPIVVVSGVDAPTGKAAEHGAISSTMRITGPAILPNGHRVDLTGCLVTADVRGDTATERAYFRPNKLTCYFDFGEVDVSIKGYTTGKDGVQGFRGRLVSKQGKALLYGAVAGAVNGIGKAFGGGGNSSVRGLVTGGDPFSLPSGQQVTQSGIAGAMTDSSEFLAEYYKGKVDELYEIIEIKPLITGSIHLLETFQMKLLEDLSNKGRGRGK